ncbi:MAG: hypothetical protein VX642_11730 [Bdellovibrionota bacterium]|nr:hypothetical protein [Bdellovibrionota bacterium]
MKIGSFFLCVFMFSKFVLAQENALKPRIWYDPSTRFAQNLVREILVEKEAKQADLFDVALLHEDVGSRFGDPVKIENLRAGDSVILSQYSERFSWLLAKWGEFLLYPEINIYINVEIMSLKNIGYGNNFTEMQILRGLLASGVFPHLKVIVHNREMADFFQKYVPRKQVLQLPHPVELLVKSEGIERAPNDSRTYRLLYLGTPDDFYPGSEFDRFLQQLAKTGQHIDLVYAPHPNFSNSNEALQLQSLEFYSIGERGDSRIKVQFVNSIAETEFNKQVDRIVRKQYENKPIGINDYMEKDESRKEISKSLIKNYELSSSYFTKVDSIISNGSTLGHIAKKLGLRVFEDGVDFILKADFKSRAFDEQKLSNQLEIARRQMNEFYKEASDFYFDHFTEVYLERTNPYEDSHRAHYFPFARKLVSKGLNVIGISGNFIFTCIKSARKE